MEKTIAILSLFEGKGKEILKLVVKNVHLAGVDFFARTSKAWLAYPVCVVAMQTIILQNDSIKIWIFRSFNSKLAQIVQQMILLFLTTITDAHRNLMRLSIPIEGCGS